MADRNYLTLIIVISGLIKTELTMWKSLSIDSSSSGASGKLSYQGKSDCTLVLLDFPIKVQIPSWVVSNITESGSLTGTWCPAAGAERGNWDVRTLLFVFTFYWGIIGSGVTCSLFSGSDEVIISWSEVLNIAATQRAPPETINPMMMLLFVNVSSNWPTRRTFINSVRNIQHPK